MYLKIYVTAYAVLKRCELHCVKLLKIIIIQIQQLLQFIIITVVIIIIIIIIDFITKTCTQYDAGTV